MSGEKKKSKGAEEEEGGKVVGGWLMKLSLHREGVDKGWMFRITNVSLYILIWVSSMTYDPPVHPPFNHADARRKKRWREEKEIKLLSFPLISPCRSRCLGWPLTVMFLFTKWQNQLLLIHNSCSVNICGVTEANGIEAEKEGEEGEEGTTKNQFSQGDY